MNVEYEFRVLLKHAHEAAPAIDHKPFRQDLVTWLKAMDDKERLQLSKMQRRIGPAMAKDMYALFKKKKE